MSHKLEKIDRIERNERWMLEEPHMIECECGGKHFNIYQPEGEYHTVAECTTCDKAYTVHTG